MRGAIYTVDPEYRKAVEEAYAAAKAQNLTSAQGYPGNNFNEYLGHRHRGLRVRQRPGARHPPRQPIPGSTSWSAR